MNDLLRVEDLRVAFRSQAGPVEALKGISFRVRPRSTVALVGESGSGKSVTAQVIMGLLPRAGRVTGGRVLFGDPALADSKVADQLVDGAIDLAALNPNSAGFRCIRGDRISMIFQEPMTSLSPLHTIGDQIGEALELHRGVGRPEARELTADMLRMVDFPDPARAPDLYPFELSGGLRQRAMIAMALVCQPSLLVADEPSTALDVTVQAQILRLIKDLQSEIGMAVLMITHDLGVVANVADEVVVVYHGEVMEAGTLDDIFRAPGHPYLKALLKAVPHFDMKRGERLVPLREIKPTKGHLLAPEAAPSGGVSKDEPLISVRNVTKRYAIRRGGGAFGIGTQSGLLAVDDVSFDIHPGECLGLVGESGCGKTTLNKIVMRALDPDEGQVLFNDDGRTVDLVTYDDVAMIPMRRKMQYVFQDPFSSLNPRMTVFDIIAEPLVIHDIGDYVYRREMVSELMGVVGLDPRWLNRYPHSFSGGQRQRIGIARSLALKPRLLLCDEPVSALDVSVQAQILNLLKDLQRELGLTFLFVSHNLAVVDYMADRIAVMCAGQLVEVAPRETLFQNPVHPYTRALLAAVPFPDPNRRLDLSALLEGRASDPRYWPEPFGPKDDARPQLIELGGGHVVRAHDIPAEAGQLEAAT